MIPEIRIVQTSDTKQILALYESLGYRQGIAPRDIVWIAESEGEPIGIVRIAPELGVLVLRACAWRNPGVGAGLARKCCM